MAGNLVRNLCLMGLKSPNSVMFNLCKVHQQSISRNFCRINVLFAEKKFSKSHEWVLQDGNLGKVGITDYAQDKLGEIVYVELPEEGTELEQEDVFGVVESVKAASDLMTPVSGKVTSVNEDLSANPSLINSSAESDGWIMELELSKPSELDALMSEADYKQFLSEGGE